MLFKVACNECWRLTFPLPDKLKHPNSQLPFAVVFTVLGGTKIRIDAIRHALRARGKGKYFAWILCSKLRMR